MNASRAAIPPRGLSKQEVQARRGRGQGNTAPAATGRTYLRIIRENVFTFVNNMLFLLGLGLVLVDRPMDAVISVGIIMTNVVVGIAQEIRAKARTLKALPRFSQVAASLAAAGLGTGIFISPNTSALMGAAPPGRQGIASGILATARSVGMVLGVGLAGAIFTSVLAGAGDSSGSALASPGSAPVFAATRASFLAAMGVAVVGALVSTTRGRLATTRTNG